MLMNVLIKFLNKIIQALGFVGKNTVGRLPESPFSIIENIEIPFLSSLNWIFPINFFIVVLSYWVLAIGIYYILAVILRWVKIIQ